MSELASSALQRFQDGFARALTTNDTRCESAAEFAAVASQPGFAVHRNTVMKGCIDALHANYPAVNALVGDEWLRAAAGIFARAHLPRQPVLLEYGEGFAAFLDTFPPAAKLPWITHLARLDRDWTEAHSSRDEAPVEAAAVARLDAAQLAVAVLRPHASARWSFFDGQPVAASWRRNRGLVEEPESAGIIIVRPHSAVQTLGLDATDCAFLDACAQGRTLADAAHAALAAEPHADLSRTMARLLNAGAFGSLTLSQDVGQEDNP